MSEEAETDRKGRDLSLGRGLGRAGAEPDEGRGCRHDRTMGRGLTTWGLDWGRDRTTGRGLFMWGWVGGVVA